MTFDEFSKNMAELGFSDSVSFSVWEGVDKSEDNKITSQSIQTTFCIALSLISTGAIAQRIQRALNWVKPATAGKLTHDELLNFCIEFFYLGSETLSFLSKSHKDIVDLIDVKLFSSPNLVLRLILFVFRFASSRTRSSPHLTRKKRTRLTSNSSTTLSASATRSG